MITAIAAAFIGYYVATTVLRTVRSLRTKFIALK